MQPGTERGQGMSENGFKEVEKLVLCGGLPAHVNVKERNAQLSQRRGVRGNNHIPGLR